MKARLVRIGNSRGVRLPKPLILQAGLTDEVELTVQGGAIVIERGELVPALSIEQQLRIVQSHGAHQRERAG